LPLVECGTQYFNHANKAGIKKFGIDKMMCIKDKDGYSISGDYYSDDFKYLQVKLLKCNPINSQVPCKDPSQLDAFFSPKQFQFAFVNSYFDALSYADPIKQFLDDSIFFQLETQRDKKADLYVMKGAVEMEDDYVHLGQFQEEEFPQVQTIRFYEDSVAQDNALVSIYIRYDQKGIFYRRETYSILDFLADIGGVQ
jgi:hypothetical protein